MSNFSDFGLDPDLLRGIESVGFEQPTPIQQDAIPPALAGRDVLACAMTGSGKTAAFLLPILHRLKEKPRGTTRVLVLAPTRELAAQIVEHMTALAKFTDMKGAAVFGGVAMGPQEKNFRKGVDVLVATPGRLLDHFQNDYAKLEGLEILVLDEADRMLDMGFLPDVRRVLQHLPRPEQTLFFSATLPPPIVELAGEMLREPARLNVERKSAPATGITQEVYPVQENLKPYLLVELLRRGDIKNVLVFTRTKHRANRLADFLEKHGVPCDRIHGNRSQVQRTDALSRFKSGDLQVLVATDIAARGIDVEALSHVINFDVPNIPEDYIHRVGRTARAEMVGDAFTFVSDEEAAELQAIEREVGSRLPRRTVEGFDYAAEPAERFEVPLQERIAAIRARRAEERARARAKAEKKAQREAEEKARLDSKAKGRPPEQRQGRPAQGPRGQQRQGDRQGEGSQPGGQQDSRQQEPRRQDGPRRGDQQPRRGDQQPRRGDQQPRRGDQQPRRHGGGEQQPRHRHVHVVTEPVREVDPTTKPTEERLVQIRNAFSPSRFNRFRR
ncbi:MAG TPA: DEAD/DEAH box helicase [Thermoanaerobaculia bacterium]|nr:DEAD/DEAH box helicase [Thermoanaerobaculia bacterium]